MNKKFYMDILKKYLLPALISVFFCIDTFAQSNQADSILNASIRKIYNSGITTKIKKDWISDTTGISRHFPDSILIRLTAKIIKEFQKSVEDKVQKNIVLSGFNIYVKNFINKNGFLEEELKIAKKERKAFEVDKFNISTAFANIAEQVLYVYVNQLTVRQIKTDTVIIKETPINDKNQKSKTGEKNPDMVVLENQKRNDSLKFAKIMTDSLSKQKNRYASSNIIKNKIRQDFLNIINLDNSYSILNLSEGDHRKLKINYWIAFELKNSDEYRVNIYSDEEYDRLVEKLGELNYVLKAYDFIQDIRSVFNGEKRELSEDNKDYVMDDDLVIWSLTPEQKRELKLLISEYKEFQRYRKGFNNLLITMDGKNETGRLKHFDEYVERRKLDEKKAEQKILIDDFKIKNLNWEKYKILKENIQKIENSDGNISFAQFFI